MNDKVIGLRIKLEMSIPGGGRVGVATGTIVSRTPNENEKFQDGYYVDFESPFFFEGDTMVKAWIFPLPGDRPGPRIDKMAQIFDGPLVTNFTYITLDGESKSPGDRGMMALVSLAPP